MPTNDPRAGETWELFDPSTERASQAVILTILHQPFQSGPGTVRLMNRLGRTIVVPMNSFLISWQYLHEAIQHSCWYRDRTPRCDRMASLQVNDPSGWVWVCDQHLPAGQQALLPFDNPRDRDNITALENQCPRCNTSLNTPGSGSEVDPETEIVLQRCGRCGSQWATFLARGNDDDGLTLSEGITAAAEALHGRATNIRAIVGFTAFTAIRRVIQPASHVVGTPVQQGNNIGANTVIVIGDRPVTGGRSAATNFTVTQDDRPIRGGDVSQREIERRPDPLMPAVGSIWQAVLGAALVEVVDIRREAPGREVVVFSVGTDPEDRSELSLREFLGRYTLNGRPRLRPGDPHPMAPLPEKGPTKPRAGDTWWHRRTGKPAFILAVEFDTDGRNIVRFNDAGPAVPLELEEFLAAYTIDPPDPGCKAGEEWVDDKGDLIKIEEVRLPRREVVGLNAKGLKTTVPLALFMARYRQVIRRSIYSRLVDDDDDF